MKFNSFEEIDNHFKDLELEVIELFRKGRKSPLTREVTSVEN
jgi:hypothetical protein